MVTTVQRASVSRVLWQPKDGSRWIRCTYGNPQVHSCERAQQAKHRLWVLSKAARDRRSWVHQRAKVFRAIEEVAPFRFDVDRYRDPNGEYPFDFFLHREPPSQEAANSLEIPDVLWCFWTGGNPMTGNRRRSMEAMRTVNADLDVRLVTAESLGQWVVSERPLHPAFEHLSAVHQSDYLRAYMLHHYGGAYMDIKPPVCGLSPLIELLRGNPDLWLAGPRDIDEDLVGNLHGRIGRDTRRNHARIVSIGCCAARPRTAFTAAWLAEVERRVSYHADDLDRFPAVDPYGTRGGYVPTWIGLGADIYQPLQLKHLDRVAVVDGVHPMMRDYR